MRIGLGELRVSDVVSMRDIQFQLCDSCSFFPLELQNWDNIVCFQRKRHPWNERFSW